MASIQSKTSKTGVKTFYVVFSFFDKRKWIKAGTLRDARLLKKKIESLEKSKRLENLGLSSNEIKIKKFFEDFSDYSRLHNSASTAKRYIRVFETFQIFLKMFHPGIKYLSQINTQIMESYQKRRLKSIKLKEASDGDKKGIHKEKRLPLPQTVNFEISVLRSALIWAKDRDFISSVPTARLKKLRPQVNKRAQILSENECEFFLTSAKRLSIFHEELRIYYLAIKFILNTGLRSGELCNLTWNDVDLEEGLIKIQAKSGWTPKSYEREFYLNKAGLEVLDGFKDKTGYIFKDQKGNQLRSTGLRRALIKFARGAGFENFTRVHDLRHTFNSLMQMKGVDPATMGKILGHKDIETTMIYTHQTKEHLKKSIEKIGI